VPKTSIIIPVYNNHQITRDCIYSIEKYTTDYEVIVVDNGSSPAFSGADRVIFNEQNLGFPKAVNQGIKAATGDVVVILNNDTLVTPHWLDRIHKHLEIYDMVGPVTNNISGPQKIEYKLNDNRIALDMFSERLYSEKEGQIYPYHRLVFFCVAVKKAVIDKIGFLDEDFTPGNFEDDDFCLRAVEAGFKLGIAEDVFIYHIGSVSFKDKPEEFHQLLQTNKAKFDKKWPSEKYVEMQMKCINSVPRKSEEKKKSLALVMIVKNEEKGLERAILSVKDDVDEIVIAVDNASWDNTEEIAKKYATTLKHFDWHDDFADVRNFAHEGVKTDWILFLDGHEYVENKPQLQGMLQSKHDGLMCTILMENGFRFGNPRIYRNGVQFKGKVHEKQQCKTTEVYEAFVIKHDRIEGQSKRAADEREAQRFEQEPRIMGEAYRKNKKDTRATFHMALHYQAYGKPKEALKWWKRFLKYNKDPGERWYAYFNMSLISWWLGRYFRAGIYSVKADAETPGRWEIKKLKGMILYEQRKYKKASEYLVDCFSNNSGIISYHPWKRDLSGTYNLIGDCLYNQGIYDKASLAYGHAAQVCDDKEFKNILAARADLMLEMLKSSAKAGGS